MGVIRYFIDLLDTLKKIERHLSKLASCVSDGIAHKPHVAHMVTGDWNDVGR